METGLELVRAGVVVRVVGCGRGERVVDVRLGGRDDVLRVEEDDVRAASVDDRLPDVDDVEGSGDDVVGDCAGDDVRPSVGSAAVDGPCGDAVVVTGRGGPPRELSEASTRTCRPAESIAYQAACALVFEGLAQPNGYTEPLLHKYRQACKARRQAAG